VVLNSRLLLRLRTALPLLLIFLLLISSNQTLALTQARDYAVNTATVRTSPVTLNVGTEGTSSISSTNDYGNVTATAGYTFYDQNSNNFQIFNPSTMKVLAGQNLAGTVSNLADHGANYVTFMEVASTPGLDFYCNFTTVPSSTIAFVVHNYDIWNGSSSQPLNNEIYNFTSASWIIVYPENEEAHSVYDCDNLALYDLSGLIQNGVVMLREVLVGKGNTNVQFSLDYIELVACSQITIFNPSTMNLLVGQNLAGTVSNLAAVDSNYVSFNEVKESPGYDFYFNFTGVPFTISFNYNMYSYFQGSAGHTVQIDLYNYTSSSWIIYQQFIGESGFIWHNNTVTDTNGLIQNGIVMGRLYESASGNNAYFEQIDYIELEVPTPSQVITADFSIPATSGSFTVAAGSSVYLISPIFPRDYTLYSGSWMLDLWASATSSGTMSVSFVAADSSNNIVATATSGNTATIGTSKSEIQTSFSGSQISVPLGGSLIANITNPTASGKTFTIYWGSGQPTNFQTPADYDYILAINNSASSSYSVNLLTYTSSAHKNWLNVTVSIYSPSTNQIILINGGFTQSSGSTVTLLPSSTLYIRLFATTYEFGSVNVVLLMKFNNTRPFAYDVINLTVN
jgi:hypothetical protein